MSSSFALDFGVCPNHWLKDDIVISTLRQMRSFLPPFVIFPNSVLGLLMLESEQ